MNTVTKMYKNWKSSSCVGVRTNTRTNAFPGHRDSLHRTESHRQNFIYVTVFYLHALTLPDGGRMAPASASEGEKGIKCKSTLT